MLFPVCSMGANRPERIRELAAPHVVWPGRFLAERRVEEVEFTNAFTR